MREIFLISFLAVSTTLGVGLHGIHEPQDFTAHRESSWDQSGGNNDFIQLNPNIEITLANITGPGMIHHIWATCTHPDLREVVIRMYWDGETNPSVESPLGDFFGLGMGMTYLLNSAPIQVGSDRGLNCFWPMPFRQEAKVTIENQAQQHCYLYFYIDYRKDITISQETPYFHAQYNQAFPASQDFDYTILNAQGKGHYVGCNMSIHLNSDGWWGEGDDKIYINGSTEPALHGTGSEDYFCGAWAYTEPFDNLYFGAPLVQGQNRHDRDAKWNVYRYHIPDPIPFSTGIRVDIETYSLEREPFPNHHCSVAYWYQTEPHLPFPPLPQNRISTLIPMNTHEMDLNYDGHIDFLDFVEFARHWHDVNPYIQTWALSN